jgi:pyridoxine 5-phosphate synthase
MKEKLRLGVNIDHVATLRNARGGSHPCPVQAAIAAEKAGADGITAHLREDRRHIRDDDMRAIKDTISIPLNFEMAATAEMQSIALEIMPHAVCLVPEKREERTTEGGLDVAGNHAELAAYIALLQGAGIRVSMFIDPVVTQIDAAKTIGAPVVELHTGTYAEYTPKTEGYTRALHALQRAANHAHMVGLEVHAGHGLRYDNVADIARITEIMELNIGHFLIGEAVFDGLETAIAKMRRVMDEARA